MNLLGNYSNRLSVWHYQELLKMLEQSLTDGDFGGGKLFDKAAADTLLKQGQDFSSLPTIAAGARATAQSVNHPLDLLNARYAAIAAERDDFLARMKQFLFVLENDARMVDQLLYAAEMQAWIAARPQLSQAKKFYADLAATHGPISDDVSNADPLTGKIYLDAAGNQRQVSDTSIILDGELLTGVGAPVESVDRTPPINLHWEVAGATGEVEQLFGTDWAKYSLLAPAPRLTYQDPAISVILPKSRATDRVLAVYGKQDAGNLPVYVKIVFAPRRRVVELFNGEAIAKATSFELSKYRISKDDLIVYFEGTSDSDGQPAGSFIEDTDYRIDVSQRLFTPLTSMDGKRASAVFTEYFPGYQCSINNLDWSPVVLFDTANPFPDASQAYFPVDIENGRFPVVDELGVPTGLQIQPTTLLEYEYLFRIETRADSTYGVRAILEVEFDRPGYMNGLCLAPFVNFPMRLKRIEAEGMITNSGVPPIFEGDVLLDRPVSIRFGDADGKPVYVRRLYLTLDQENYALKEHRIDQADKLCRDTIARLQSVLPFTSSRYAAATPRRVVGAQYEFGLRDIAGERWESAAPGTLVSGPFEVTGTPEIVRLDADIRGAVDAYLMYQIFDQNGASQGVFTTSRMAPDTALSFAATASAQMPAVISKVQFYINWVFREEFSVLQRFLLQVSTEG